MQKLQLHIRSLIDTSSETYTGLRARFRTIPSRLIRVICDDQLNSIEKGEVIRDSEGSKFVVLKAETVANNLLLDLLAVPDDY